VTRVSLARVRCSRLALMLLGLMVSGVAAGREAAMVLDATFDIEPVWSGHPVGFLLDTRGSRQYVAYYDADRQMSVAQRELGSDAWTIQKLPEHVGWDSHNRIEAAFDATGRMHLSGNMHVAPMVYFRMAEPHDVTTLTRLPHMVGPEREQRATYPEFLRGADDELIFTYRDGSSGSGDQIYNVYDTGSQTWVRLLDTPIVSGEGRMNAYFRGPLLGPDGYFHLAWVWRDTPDAATNHDVSYARSRDLVRWEGSDGGAFALPITLASAEIVDPVAAGAGLLNGGLAIGFDHDDRVILTYHRHDDAGDMQVHAARRDAAGWRVRQVSDWSGYRWEFGGGGSLPSVEVRVGSVEPRVDGRLALSYRYKHGSGIWSLDPETLVPIGEIPKGPDPVPPSIREVESAYPGMGRRVMPGSTSAVQGDCRYFLTWETLGRHRDRPREEAPPPSMLRVVRLQPESP
jgi:hypothetical protein